MCGLNIVTCTLRSGYKAIAHLLFYAEDHYLHAPPDPGKGGPYLITVFPLHILNFSVVHAVAKGMRKETVSVNYDRCFIKGASYIL